ncbi:MAG: alpha-1,3-galactosidase B [Muribaculaceae bacterium]|nr:alpha-1,3-galactosidase B [Muribaculaceae bacterium]
MKNRIITSVLSAMICMAAFSQTVVDMAADYGIRPGSGKNMSAKLNSALADIKKRYGSGAVSLRFAPGRYDFHPKGSASREYYISNHDQANPKAVGFAIEHWDSLTIDADGADFIFHGRMLPIAVVDSRNFSLKGASIDFETPHITQVTVLDNTSDGITFRTAPWVNAGIDKNGNFIARGEDWAISPRSGIAFDATTRHVVYRTSDLWCPLDSVIALKPKGTYRAPKWTDARLTPGTVVALRGWGRPAPGIFLSGDSATSITDVKVHYAEGMGLLAQLCDGITLTRFGVCLRGDSDPRYFTTQADATHFSGCKGVITSTEGLYEGMMDDAINVHGTYLKVIGRTGKRTLRGRYMHDQSWGFRWGLPGDSVQIIRSETMETVGQPMIIENINPADSRQEHGAREFDVTFTADLPDAVADDCHFGMENLSWAPEVYFADNVVRNNRARGSLFSTPRRVMVERNLFDHTSGTAILLCGDCMGWFETGACRDVTIRQNRFVNSLTNMFQFTEAIISIYPEIHDLSGQRQYFHSGILIEDNDFITFDAPLLYAKSTDGLSFRGNRVRINGDFPPFHPNQFNFKLQRCRNVTVTDNELPQQPSILIE